MAQKWPKKLFWCITLGPEPQITWSNIWLDSLDIDESNHVWYIGFWGVSYGFWGSNRWKKGVLTLDKSYKTAQLRTQNWAIFPIWNAPLFLVSRWFVVVFWVPLHNIRLFLCPWFVLVVIIIHLGDCKSPYKWCLLVVPWPKPVYPWVNKAQWDALDPL